MQMHLRFNWALGVLLLLLISVTASGQVVPDTVYRKPSLPAGPPGEIPQQQQPRPQQPRPPVPVQEQPTVVRDSQEPQFEEKVPLIDKLYYGGGFGLQFGTFTNISLSPILGVMVTEKFWAGGGLMYDYLSARGISLQNVGGKAFMQFEFVENFIAHAEYDLLSVENFYYDSNSRRNVKYREMVGIPLAGLGYRQRMGPRASADILVLYNFGPASYGLYSNPVIRFSFNIPFRR